MSSSHLRELVMYQRKDEGGFTKVRRTITTLNQPRDSRQVFSGPKSLYFLRVFSPEGRFTLAWGVVMLIAIIYQVVTVPYFLAFETSDNLETLALDLACTLIYLADILVTMNTSFYTKGLLVTHRNAIFKRYLRTWLFPDLISSFPYTWILQGPMSPSAGNNARTPTVAKVVKITRMVRTLRLLRVARIRQYLSLLEQKISNKLSIVFTLVYLSALMMTIAHWAACGFYYMSQSSDSVNSWIVTFQMENSEQVDQYVTALYWAVTTLTTTGYGDIVPITTYERIYGIVIMVMSAGVFSYFIGKIGTVIAMIESDSSEQKELVMDVSRYLKATDVPNDITSRALRYLDYVWETRTRRKVLDKSIFTHFSEPLKNEISEHIFGKVLTRVHLMHLFDTNFISQLARGVEPQIYAQDDVVFECGQTSSDLYFLEKGSVEIYHKATQHTFKVLKPGKHFGEIAFFTGAQRSASARCVTFSELLSINRAVLLDLQRISPSGKYSLQLICDKLKAKEYYDSGISCYICKDFTHLAFECDRSKVWVDREALKQKWMMKKRILSSRMVSATSAASANFCRKHRKISVISRYAKINVQSNDGWTRLKGAKYSLSKLLANASSDPKSQHDETSVVSHGVKDDMEYCQIDLSERYQTEIPEERPSPPISPQRRYSILGGVRTYALFDELRRVPMERLSVVPQSSSGDESSADPQSD